MGTYVVLGFVKPRTAIDWLRGGRQPPPHFARLVRGGDSLLGSLAADERERSKKVWPDPTLYDKEGLCGMHRTNVFPYIAICLVESRIFQTFNMACLSMSIICLLLEDPLDDQILNPEFPERRNFLMHLSNTFNLIFIFEGFLQIMAKGLVYGKQSYLRDGALSTFSTL